MIVTLKIYKAQSQFIGNCMNLWPQSNWVHCALHRIEIFLRVNFNFYGALNIVIWIRHIIYAPKIGALMYKEISSTFSHTFIYSPQRKLVIILSCTSISKTVIRFQICVKNNLNWFVCIDLKFSIVLDIVLDDVNSMFHWHVKKNYSWRETHLNTYLFASQRSKSKMNKLRRLNIAINKMNSIWHWNLLYRYIVIVNESSLFCICLENIQFNEQQSTEQLWDVQQIEDTMIKCKDTHNLLFQHIECEQVNFDSRKQSK